MSGFADILGAFVFMLGAAFLALGGLGLMRMPDSFNRIQAGAKTTTLGMLLILTGAGIIQPDFAPKLLLVALFLLFTNPLSSQVLARAAERTHAPKSPKTRMDQYEDDHPDKDEDTP